jgi:isopenicillin-N N-acyltransferase-like protein
VALRTYPRIRVSGEPVERGGQYGEQARDRIRISRAGYERAFREAAGWDWDRAVDAASGYAEPIERAFPHLLAELRGIAEGSGLTLGDLLAMNARTEVIWAATARQAAAQRAEYARECTSFALLAGRTVEGRPLVGQNWDWLVQGFDTVVVLEVEQPGDRPNFVTVVEAGLLAKASLNSAGLGITTNALVTGHDRGEAGIPYHVMLRALADCETLTDAVNTVQLHQRASSANYLLAHADDIAVDLEAAPGDFRTVTALLPDAGVLVHTNHFLQPPRATDEVSIYAMPDSLVRLQRARAALVEAAGGFDIKAVSELLSDHADWPAAVCCHPDPREADAQRWATVMSVVMDLQQRTLWLASGNPCEQPFQQLKFGELLHKAGTLAGRPGQAPR